MAYYGTLNGADTYLGDRVGGANWLEQNETYKGQLLQTAFDLIESMTYIGDPVGDNQFPRDDDTEVPTNVINAQYQLAYCLLVQNVDLAESINRSIKRAKIGPVETEYFEGRIDTGFDGVICPRAWSLIRSYLDDPSELTLIRQS